MGIFFNKNWRNSALKTREKPYYGKNSRTACFLNSIKHYGACNRWPAFHFQTSKFDTRSRNILYRQCIGCPFPIWNWIMMWNNFVLVWIKVKQFCTCVNKIKQTIINLFLIVAVILGFHTYLDIEPMKVHFRNIWINGFWGDFA